MKTKTFILIGIVIYLFTSCNNAKKDIPVTQRDIENKTSDTSIHRGKYLVTIMDCHTCHSPNIMTDQGPIPDISKILSGYPSNRPKPDYDDTIKVKGALFPNPDLCASIGPWGMSFAANITPDKTGIGSWSLEQFSIAMREGKYKGMKNSRDLLPPMPWRSYAHLTDTDLEAIFRYLKSIPPVVNVVPAPISPSGN